MRHCFFSFERIWFSRIISPGSLDAPFPVTWAAGVGGDINKITEILNENLCVNIVVKPYSDR